MIRTMRQRKPRPRGYLSIQGLYMWIKGEQQELDDQDTPVVLRARNGAEFTIEDIKYDGRDVVIELIEDDT